MNYLEVFCLIFYCIETSSCLLLLISSSIPLFSENTLCIVSITLNHLRFILSHRIRLSWQMSHGALHSLPLLRLLCMSVGSCSMAVLFMSSIFFLVFCVWWFYQLLRKVILNFAPITVELAVLFFSSLCSCVIYFESVAWSINIYDLSLPHRPILFSLFKICLYL